MKTILLGWRSKMVMVMIVMACVVSADPANASEPEGMIGPDVVVFELPNTSNYGVSGGIRAYAVGTTSCNRGDTDLDWISNTNEHPVIAQNLYRVTLPDPPGEHGKIEMLGISWLKHGFFSVNGTQCDSCDHPGTGSKLGVGCSDPYSSGLNGSQGNLGPRSEVNAFTGYFPYDNDDPPGPPVGDSTTAGRLQVFDAEIINAPSTYKYFIEGQYVTPDDATSGNGMNNASYREAVLDSDDDLDPVGATIESFPGLYAWQAVDPTVTISEVIVPNEGLFVVGFKASDNGDGTWHYQYSVFNMNSHLSGRGFSVPITANSVITNISFRDVDYHSGEPYDGTDWAVDIDPTSGWLTWYTDDYATNPNANALRWSTMYNFSFDADSSPEDALASIAIFRDGGPSSVSVYVRAPASNLVPLFDDDFETGDTGAWSAVSP